MAVNGPVNPYVDTPYARVTTQSQGITIPSYQPPNGRIPIYSPAAPAPGATIAPLNSQNFLGTTKRTMSNVNSGSLPGLQAQGWTVIGQQHRPYDPWIDAPGGGSTTYTLSKDFPGGETDTLRNLLTAFVDSYNTGQNVNEQRYSEILGGYRDRYAQAMQSLQGLGSAAQTDINQQFDRLGSKTTSDLITRGLGNTTIAGSMQRGVESERAKAMGQLNEALRREAIGYQAGLSGDLLKYMENRQDSYPTLDQIGDIALAYSQVGKNQQQGGTVVGG